MYSQEELISNLLDRLMNSIVASITILFAIKLNFESPYKSNSHHSLLFILLIFRAVTTIFILGGLEVTIRGGLTIVEAEELRKFYDFQTSKHAITCHILLNLSQCYKSRDPKSERQYTKISTILVDFNNILTTYYIR